MTSALAGTPPRQSELDAKRSEEQARCTAVLAYAASTSNNRVMHAAKVCSDVRMNVLRPSRRFCHHHFVSSCMISTHWPL